MNKVSYPQNLVGLTVIQGGQCDTCPNEPSDCKKVHLQLSDGSFICLAPVSGASAAGLEDGVYLVYNDDTFCKFSPDASKDGLNRVGLVHAGHAFCVDLHEKGCFQLLRDNVRCERESPFYVESECEALNAWGCVEQTKRIQALGTDIPLAEGEYLPALPMLVAMRYWAERGLNDALEFAGGEPLSMGSNHWSATEYGSNYAWGVYFGSGNVGSNSKCYGPVARAVTAFPLHSLE